MVTENTIKREKLIIQHRVRILEKEWADEKKQDLGRISRDDTLIEAGVFYLLHRWYNI